MTAAHLIATQEPLPPPDALAPRWQVLEARAEGAFFTTWTWIGSWLRATGARPDLVGQGADGQLAERAGADADGDDAHQARAHLGGRFGQHQGRLHVAEARRAEATEHEDDEGEPE